MMDPVYKGDIGYNAPLLGYWRRLHYYEDGNVNRAISVPRGGYACFDTTNYRKTITLSEDSRIRVTFVGFFNAVTSDVWRNVIAHINYGTGGTSIIGSFGGCGFYHAALTSGRITYASIALAGERVLSAGSHTIEIRANCWDASANLTKFYNGVFAIDVCKA
ncbi:hypothetical protein KKB44_06725 [Candidatus Micrarchaeota archaeon]|nr:hypothetical protein [Candidatus Micrarchaeota archaeon]